MLKTILICIGVFLLICLIISIFEVIFDRARAKMKHKIETQGVFLAILTTMIDVFFWAFPYFLIILIIRVAINGK